MYQASEIQTKLFGVVGIRNGINPQFSWISLANQASSSGRYVQDFSGYVSVENLHNSFEYGQASNSDLNTGFANYMKAAVCQVCDAIFGRDGIIENRVLYENSNIKTNLLTNGTDFVGYEIELMKDKSIAVFINSIITEFSGAGALKILLWHDSDVTIKDHEDITVLNTSSMETVVDWRLPFSNSTKGGKYYIGYLTNGLTPQAINRTWNASNLPNIFNTCRIKPIKVSGHNSETLFSLSSIEYTADTYGLNFDITGMRDYTSIIEQNKNYFTESIGLQFAVNALNRMISTNSDYFDPQLKANINLELQGNTTLDNMPTSVGLVKRLEKELIRLKSQLVDDPLYIVGTLT